MRLFDVMTLRDYFACFALVATAIREPQAPPNAERAFEIADMMLEFRDKDHYKTDKLEGRM